MLRVLSYQEYYQMASSEFKEGDIIEARVVMVIGYGKDYAIYVAPDGSWNARKIARQGDKICGTTLLKSGHEETEDTWAANRAEVVGSGLFPSATVDRWPRR